MRLLLFPLTRTGAPSECLLYCHRLTPPSSGNASSKPPLSERITAWSAKTWVAWEHAPKGWKKSVTSYGNRMLKRVPHQEWGLKSIPPRRGQASQRVEYNWPQGLTRVDNCRATLGEMGGKERQTFHGKRLWWSVAVMPLTAPMALLPVIPNLPFFFLCFRAWSHWKAREGSRHLDFLLSNDLTEPRPSEIMRRAYDLATLVTSIQRLEEELVQLREKKAERADEGSWTDEILLSKNGGKILADVLEIPELEEEVERAVWQVRRALKERAKAESGERPNR